jgi:regulator of sigma E protease
MPTKFKEPPQRERSGLNVWSLLFLGAIVVTIVLGEWTWLIGILGLAFLVTVHEFGHFIAAKSFGMRVEKFYVGFPPAAWKRNKGETEYGVGIIPLGGFCKISGMTPEEEVPEDTGDRVYYKKPIWQRNVTIFAGPLMNFVAAVLILFVFVWVQGTATATLTLDVVQKGTPAASIGLKPGDTLVGADGQKWSGWDAASGYLRTHPDGTIRLTYLPGGQPPAKTVTVKLTTSATDKSQGFLGVSPTVTTRRVPPWRAGWLALTGTKDVFKGTFTGFYWLFSGKINPTGKDGAVGPVGIINVSHQAVQQRWYPILLAFLSVNLGLINLLPILPFDGGHIFFNVVEKIRGRRVDARWLERVVAFGTALLVLLFIFLTFNDLRRIFGA